MNNYRFQRKPGFQQYGTKNQQRILLIALVILLVSTIVLGVLFAKGKGTHTGSVMDKAGALPAPVAPAAPMAAPAPASGLPSAAPLAEPSAPMALQMGAGGELAPVETPAAEAPAAPVEEAPAAAPAAEGETAPQD